MVDQDPKLGQRVADKIYFDMLSTCYDKIADYEATRYYDETEYQKIECDTPRFNEMLPYDIYKYINWKSEEELMPNIHQRVLMNSLKVRELY